MAPPGFHEMTQRAKTCISEGTNTSPKFNEKTPRENTKNENSRARGRGVLRREGRRETSAQGREGGKTTNIRKQQTNIAQKNQRKNFNLKKKLLSHLFLLLPFSKKTFFFVFFEKNVFGNFGDCFGFLTISQQKLFVSLKK